MARCCMLTKLPVEQEYDPFVEENDESIDGETVRKKTNQVLESLKNKQRNIPSLLQGEAS